LSVIGARFDLHTDTSDLWHIPFTWGLTNDLSKVKVFDGQTD